MRNVITYSMVLCLCFASIANATMRCCNTNNSQVEVIDEEPPCHGDSKKPADTVLYLITDGSAYSSDENGLTECEECSDCMSTAHISLKPQLLAQIWPNIIPSIQPTIQTHTPKPFLDPPIFIS